MGRRHIQVVRELELDLIGICDPNLDTLALADKEQGIPIELHYPDAPSLFKEKQSECIIVTTAAPTPCEYTCLAAKQGANYILCEKPTAISFAQCDQILESSAKHDTRLAINHQTRFMKQYAEPKRLIS